MTKSKQDFFYLLFISKHECVVYLEPANVEEELQQGENRDVQVDSVLIVSLFRVQKLSANHTEGKKRVNCYRDQLHKLKGGDQISFAMNFEIPFYKSGK